MVPRTLARILPDGCCCLGPRQCQGTAPLWDRHHRGLGWAGSTLARLCSILCHTVGNRGCFSEKLLPPKVEYESGFGATLITTGSIGSAWPSKIQLQPRGPACSALPAHSALPACLWGGTGSLSVEALQSPWPSTQPPGVRPHPAHGASTHWLSPSRGCAFLEQGSRWRCPSLARAARGNAHAPEPLSTPNAWSRSVLLDPPCTLGTRLGTPWRAEWPWQYAGSPSYAQGWVGGTCHPFCVPTTACSSLPSHPGSARYCINSCLCLHSAPAWEIISADGT